MNRIVIKVLDGLVEGVYAENADVVVDIIDCDTDDPERAEIIDAELDELSKDIKEGKMFTVY